MDDQAFKQKYKKYKLRVKLWERDFKKKYGRVPSKYDIRDAAQEIKDSYKMYYKLKTTFLEDTLNDVLSDDGFDVLEISQAENCEGDYDENCLSFNGGPQLPLDISAIVQPEDHNKSQESNTFSNIKELPTPSVLANLVNRDETDVIKTFEAVEDFKSNKDAWNEKVSKKPLPQNGNPNQEDADIQAKSAKLNLNAKLFKTSSSFTKRNPRKSLSRANFDASVTSGKNVVCSKIPISQEKQLPDLETILTHKAKEQQVASIAKMSSSNLLAPSENKVTNKINLDEGWLARNTSETASSKVSSSKDCMDTQRLKTANSPSIAKKSYGLANIELEKILPALEKKPQTNPVSLALSNEKMYECDEDETKIPGKVSSETQHECMNSDSDSVVSGSDDETRHQKYRHRAKRRRILETVNESSTVAVHGKENMPIKEVPQPGRLAVPVLNENVEAKDFSPDECEKDPDYKNEDKTTAKRKKVANRTKPSKTKAKAKAAKPSEAKAKQRIAPQRKTRATSKTKQAGNDDDPAVLDEPQPLHPDDLRTTLTLEGGNLTTVPRVAINELEQADAVVNRYINTTKMIGFTSKPTPTSMVNEKREAERLKFEQKIASGKLNENYVLINIEKKRFVRGKKTVNYSRFKKKQWRDKKRVAALTGPDMDMRGCDGGVLTCFTCGQPGHFAQHCKVKGDSLLPLTAQLEEDPSPFPTLEEAAQMATQSAVSVHSRNINKLPQAMNTALFSKNDAPQKTDEDMESQNSNCNKESEVEDSQEESICMDSDDDDELGAFDLDSAIATAQNPVSPIKQYVGHKIPESFLKKVGFDASDLNGSSSQANNKVGSLYDLNEDGTTKDVTPEVLEALHMFGHTSFRKGQDRAIMRILSGLSTLVTLSTGSGKSLCYQLPAYLYSRQKKSITLVISPLVSLMEDQVTGVPHFLRAHCLHTNQTKPQRAKILQMISNGEIDILLVSPEAVVSGERSTGFGSILRQLPPIAFACIDEAHCVSQWSHNFRPSYLMICKVLKKNLNVRTVLGLTATATLPTRLSIIEHLGILDGESGIISDIPLPDNLILSVSKDANRDAALLQLLNSERLEQCQSVIIYCTRRDECERVAGFLRTCMQDRTDSAPNNGNKKRKRVSWQAEPYHAGMPSSRRRTIQNAFMKNELRIVVATIAFGMGINKPDIRAVIHYNMPRNFESYVQEIGRAGRDGKMSHCHLFLDARGGDQNELRRHIYANSLDRHVLRKLLKHIFVPCSCRKNENGSEDQHSLEQAGSTANPIERACTGHEIGFSIEETVAELDIPEENISTLLCYMELDSRWNIQVLSSAYMKAKVISYGGPKYLKHAAKECPPLAMAIAWEIKKGTFKEDTNIIEFPVVDIAAAIGWNSGVVKHQLKNLEWINVNGQSQRSPISVQFLDLGFRIKAPGDFTSTETDDALDTLYNRSVQQERTQLIQLQYVFQGLSSVAFNNYMVCSRESFPLSRSEQLKAIIREYFQNDYPQDLQLEFEPNADPDEEIISDIHSIIDMYPENNFSGRTVARIFHGITSPNYPAVIWGRCKYWRAHCKNNFNHIVKLANATIVKRRT